MARRRTTLEVALLALALAASPAAAMSVEPGAQLQSLDDDRRANGAPLNMDFLRIIKPQCTRCLKACLGGKIQTAQVTAMKIQAPLSLVTWYLFKNRPFSMIPLEQAIGKLLGIHPAVYGGAAAGAYMSCRSLCDIDCPYPGGASTAVDEFPELDDVDPSDTRFLARLYQRGGGGGGKRGGGGFADALSEMFRV